MAVLNTDYWWQMPDGDHSQALAVNPSPSEENRYVFQPKTPEALAQLLFRAAAVGTTLSIQPFDVAVDLAQHQVDVSLLNQVHWYSAPDFTITVGAGMTVGELNAFLAPHRQRFPLNAPPETLLIEVLGEDAAYSDSGQRGYSRDWVLGLQVATPDGHLTHCGGRVMKNVSGYDLGKLYCGSYQTLAVITAVTLKLTALVESTVTLTQTVPTVDAALAVAECLVNSEFSPDALEMFSVGVAPHGWQIQVTYAGLTPWTEAAFQALLVQNSSWQAVEPVSDLALTNPHHPSLKKTPMGITLDVTLPQGRLTPWVQETLLPALPMNLVPQWQIFPQVPYLRLSWPPEVHEQMMASPEIAETLIHCWQTLRLSLLPTAAQPIPEGVLQLQGLHSQWCSVTAEINFSADAMVRHYSQRLKNQYDPVGVLVAHQRPVNRLSPTLVSPQIPAPHDGSHR